MADTNHAHAAPPVEGDGVNYRGIVWFVVILTATTVFCQLLVWGAFEVMERVHVTNSGVVRSPLAMPAAQPTVNIVDESNTRGQIVSGLQGSSVPAGVFQPGILVDEPAVLRRFRSSEDAALSSYGWIGDKASGVVRLPIARAKALVLERGLPARSERPGGAQPLAPVAPAPPAGPSNEASGGTAR
jgi:hypothetical protein